MCTSAILTLLAFSSCLAAAAGAGESEAIEPLFLEFSIQEVLTNKSWIPLVEPWASQYVRAARYHIAGDVHDGIVGGTTNTTVLQSIEEDALDYKLNDPEDYASAQQFYAKTSDRDGHKDIIQTLSHVYNQDINHLEARISYTTTCSNRFNAAKDDCTELFRRMSTRKVNIGNGQGVATWGTCRLRVSRYRGAWTDLTYNTANAVSRLIESDCSHTPDGFNFPVVSGFSPRNREHRKVCLSRKTTGCS